LTPKHNRSLSYVTPALLAELFAEGPWYSFGLEKISPVRNAINPPSMARMTYALASALLYQSVTLTYSRRINSQLILLDY
jgi:hypothetical protein